MCSEFILIRRKSVFVQIQACPQVWNEEQVIDYTSEFQWNQTIQWAELIKN